MKDFTNYSGWSNSATASESDDAFLFRRSGQVFSRTYADLFSAAGLGNVTSGASVSVDGEIALFSGTGGKAVKRATATGIPKLTNGVLGIAIAGTDYATPASVSAVATTANAALPAASAVVGGGAGTVPKLDGNANLLVGQTTGSCHAIKKAGASTAGTAILAVTHDGAGDATVFYVATGTGASATNTVLRMGKESGTSRSINAAGTINAAGADCAEYETKRPDCAVVGKGQVIGFDANGLITDKWEHAVAFGVKSTDPHIVGGDTWGSEDKVGPRPAEPAEDASEEVVTQYIAELAEFNTRLELARQKVDRIAYSGKCPVNALGNPGDYIIAVQDGEGIAGQAVSSPTFEQYRLAVGKIRKVLDDGRVEIAVIVH